MCEFGENGRREGRTFLYGSVRNYSDAGTMQEYDVSQVSNALVMSVCYAPECTICSPVRIRTVHTTWTHEDADAPECYFVCASTYLFSLVLCSLCLTTPRHRKLTPTARFLT
jgi:hypothetical protein